MHLRGPRPRLLRLCALLCALLPLGAGSASANGSVSGTVVAAETTGPILVYLAEVPQKLRGALPSPLPRARIEQRSRQFVPSSLVVRQGQFVEFANRDHGYHDVYSLSPGNEFSLGLSREGEPRAVEMRAAGEVEVYCDLHPDMAARILVLQNEFQTQVGPGGGYVLRDVPPGSYTVVTWSPGHQSERRRVRVYEGAVSQADFALRPRKAPEGHLGARGTSEPPGAISARGRGREDP